LALMCKNLALICKNVRGPYLYSDETLTLFLTLALTLTLTLNPICYRPSVRLSVCQMGVS